MTKRLGQHFLKDERVLRGIVSALDVTSGNTIVEIGPGHGELTKFILEASPEKVVVIERDETLASELAKNLPELQIVTGDAVRELQGATEKLGEYKLAGNIPYYITGKLLRVVSELKNMPSVVVLMIQKEVAERICAEPPKMNLLSASVKFWGEPEIIRTISRHAFRPRPKVQSAIIRITPRKIDRNEREMDKYYTLIRALFKQPRKTISNNLSEGLDLPKQEVEKILKSQGIEPKLRPQNLDVEAINNLSQSF